MRAAKPNDSLHPALDCHSFRCRVDFFRAFEGDIKRCSGRSAKALTGIRRSIGWRQEPERTGQDHRRAQPKDFRRGIPEPIPKHIYDVTLRGEYSHAAADCQLILRLATTADSGEDAAAARVHLGYILRESGDLAGSLDAISQALDFYRASRVHPRLDCGATVARDHVSEAIGFCSRA